MKAPGGVKARGATRTTASIRGRAGRSDGGRLVDESDRSPTMIDRRTREAILLRYREGRSRLLLLDYDGTLVPFTTDPAKAAPGRALLDMLASLSSEARNDVVIISGRDRQTLERWFGSRGLSLVAEHGALLKVRGEGRWRRTGPLSTGWKKDVRPVVEAFMDRAPGSVLEEKEFSIALHYRGAEPRVGESCALELATAISPLSRGLGISIMMGDKVLEIMGSCVSKGVAACRLLRSKRYDFILAIGDDRTDEAMFKALPEHSVTVKVGRPPSSAKHRIADQASVLPFLQEMAGKVP